MMRNWNNNSRQRFLDYRMPDDFIMQFLGTRYESGTFAGAQVIDPDNSISVVKFFPHKNMEHWMFLGSDANEIVKAKAGGKQCEVKVFASPPGVSHMITDVAFLAHDSNKAVVGCAEGILDVLEFSSNTRMRCIGGHTRTIRQVATHVSDSNLIATCGKDGHIFVWDLRSLTPKMSIQNAHHPTMDGRSHSYDITSLKFVSDKIVVTGSEAKTDLRFWDLRYQKVNKPMLRKTIPPESGRVMTLETSRTGREIYAVMSNQEILEYYYLDQGDLTSRINQRRFFQNDIEQAYPSRRMRYPRLLRINSEFVTTAKYSPVSDHLLVGGYGAKVYDTHREIPYFNDASVDELISMPLEPKFYLGNFENSFPTTVDWSADGRFIATLNLQELTIWDQVWPKDEQFVRCPIDWNSDEIEYEDNAYVTKLPCRPEPFLRVRINSRLAKRGNGYSKPLKVLYTENEETVINTLKSPQVYLATPKKISYKRKCNDENVFDKHARLTPKKQCTPNRGQRTLDAFFMPEKR